MFLNRYSILVVFFFGSLFPITAQNIDSMLRINPFFAESKINYGFIASHHPDMDILVKKHFPSWDISFGINTSGAKAWHEAYLYPSYGITLFHANVGNREVLGNATALMPFFEFPLYYLGKSVSQRFRLSAGVGYMSKQHDYYLNYKNTAISTPFNAAITMAYTTNVKLSPKINIISAIGLTHLSNGAAQMPNNGINLPSASLAFRYQCGKLEMIQNTQPEDIDKSWSLDLIGGYGYKSIYKTYDNKKFDVFFLESNVVKSIGYKSSLLAGLDFTFDKSDFEMIDRLQNIEVNHDLDILKYGFHIGHNLKIADLSISVIAGKYLYALEKREEESVYDKIAIRYYFKNKYIFNIYLKSHFAIADYVGYGIGYRF